MRRRGVKPVSGQFRPTDWLDCGGETLSARPGNTCVRSLRKAQGHIRVALSVEPGLTGFEDDHGFEPKVAGRRGLPHRAEAAFPGDRAFVVRCSGCLIMALSVNRGSRLASPKGQTVWQSPAYRLTCLHNRASAMPAKRGKLKKPDGTAKPCGT